ncbi:MAG: hypothetical protein K6C95_07185 [Lachnospiraceae bacterium]|nr:hypothetical protein [Lachnospiraceae bacterium]
MIYAQMGWLSSVYNWILDKIMKPVFKFVSGLLSEAFNWVYTNILQPVLTFVFETVLGELIHAILTAICTFFLTVMQLLLRAVQALEELFDIFAGLQDVTLILNRNEKLTGPLLVVLFRTPFIQKSLIVLSGIGFSLCFVFAIAAVLRSIADFDGRTGKPVGHVLRMTANAALRFVLIPIMGVFMIVLSSAVLQSINNAFFANSGGASIARTIFVMTTFDAVDTRTFGNAAKEYNCSTTSDGSKIGFNDQYRGKFYNPAPNGKEDYFYDLFEVMGTFDIVNISYFTGYFLSLCFIVLLMAALFVFMCRVFDVLLLLIVEPLFIAPMPFDDGEHFQKWMELFLGKLFGGYGMVLAMNIFLIVSGSLFKPGITLVERSGPFAAQEDGLIKMVFMLGGCYAVLNIGPLVTSILSQSASQTEAGQMATGQALGMGAVSTLGNAAVFAGQKTAGLIGKGRQAYSDSRHRSKVNDYIKQNRGRIDVTYGAYKKGQSAPEGAINMRDGTWVLIKSKTPNLGGIASGSVIGSSTQGGPVDRDKKEKKGKAGTAGGKQSMDSTLGKDKAKGLPGAGKSSEFKGVSLDSAALKDLKALRGETSDKKDKDDKKTQGAVTMGGIIGETAKGQSAGTTQGTGGTFTDKAGVKPAPGAGTASAGTKGTDKVTLDSVISTGASDLTSAGTLTPGMPAASPAGSLASGIVAGSSASGSPTAGISAAPLAAGALTPGVVTGTTSADPKAGTGITGPVPDTGTQSMSDMLAGMGQTLEQMAGSNDDQFKEKK